MNGLSNPFREELIKIEICRLYEVLQGRLNSLPLTRCPYFKTFCDVHIFFFVD